MPHPTQYRSFLRRGKDSDGGSRRDRGTKSQRGGEERRDGELGSLAWEDGLYLNICAGVPSPWVLVTPLMMGPVCLYLARTGLKSQSASDKTSQLIIWFGECPFAEFAAEPRLELDLVPFNLNLWLLVRVSYWIAWNCTRNGIAFYVESHTTSKSGDRTLAFGSVCWK